MDPPPSHFWSVAELVDLLLEYCDWEIFVAITHLSKKLREVAQCFLLTKINGRLSAFVPEDHSTQFWKSLKCSRGAIIGELPLTLLAHGPASLVPIGDVLEILVPEGMTEDIFALFDSIGYRGVESTPPDVVYASSYGMKHMFCLAMNMVEQGSSRKWVVIKESSRSCIFFPLLFYRQIAEMNMITAQTIFSVYPKATQSGFSLPNVFIGDACSASPDLLNRQKIDLRNHVSATDGLCGLNCPSVQRITQAFAGFGIFSLDSKNVAMKPAPNYMWRRGATCQNHNCDNFAFRRFPHEMPTAPASLYLFNDINLRLKNLCDAKTSLTQKRLTTTAFGKHFWQYMSALCDCYRLSSARTLLKVIDSCDAILGGSAALYLFCPTTCWPTNLDFYLPSQDGYENALSVFLLGKGYCLYLHHGHSSAGQLCDIVERTELYCHPESNTLIRLIYATSNSPLPPLLDAHSTLIMNFISGRQAICIYPTLTLDRIGVRLQNHNMATEQFEKCAARGFTLRPRRHSSVPPELWELSSLKKNNALVLSFARCSSAASYDEISWFLPDEIKKKSGWVFVQEEDEEYEYEMFGDFMIYR